jgi:hypothetical protein
MLSKQKREESLESLYEQKHGSLTKNHISAKEITSRA